MYGWHCVDSLHGNHGPFIAISQMHFGALLHQAYLDGETRAVCTAEKIAFAAIGKAIIKDLESLLNSSRLLGFYCLRHVVCEFSKSL